MAYRTFIQAAFFGTFVFAGAALAAPTDSVVRQLQDLGYSNIKISRTMLGRARIVGETRAHRREIIINPSTGEILRDLVDNGGGATQATVRATTIGNAGTAKTGTTGNGGSNANANAGNDNGNSSGGNGGGNGNGNGGGNGS